jgi:hypothetical protein
MQRIASILPQEGSKVTDGWRGGTIYEIYPQSFIASNGCGIGDLASITARLQAPRVAFEVLAFTIPFYGVPIRPKAAQYAGERQRGSARISACAFCKASSNRSAGLATTREKKRAMKAAVASSSTDQ